jgi:hydrogenase nickel incorporation protein HypA/HybF
VHEVSIATAMISELTRIAGENNARKVTAVNLRIGRLSGIVTDSLKFAFDIIKLDHPLLSSAEIMIEEIPLKYECRECLSIFETDNAFYPSCPDCRSYKLNLLSGEEMDIKDLEIEV